MNVNSNVERLEAALDARTRYVDMCLVLARKADGIEFLRVGGRFDRTVGAYLDEDPADLQVKRILVNDNQVATVEKFREWLEARLANLPRKNLLITGGDRRGGKSFIVTALACAAAIAIPDAQIWYVSPTLKRRDELERYTKAHVPAEWRHYVAREMTFRFVNGARIVNLTGDDAEDLKRGEATLIVYNEPQSMSEDVLTYGAPAIVDSGGLLLFAGNPARRRKGVWFTRLVRAVEAGKYEPADFCRLSAKDNPDIDREAKSNIGDLLRLTNPEAARADDEGVFLEPGNFAYAEHFDERRNTVPSLPSGLQIITGDILRRRGGGRLDILCGVDFQGWPFNAGVELVATGDSAAPTYYATRCLMVEGDEDYFLDDAYEFWKPERTFWIGDASGSWQDARHTRGRCSYEKFKARRSRIEPPQKKKSDRGEHPANPPREDRINLVNALLDKGRLIVCMDTAAPVAEALARCEVDSKGRPRGRYSHLTDALGYPLWWATPQPGETPRSWPGGKVPFRVIERPRSGVAGTAPRVPAKGIRIL